MERMQRAIAVRKGRNRKPEPVLEQKEVIPTNEFIVEDWQANKSKANDAIGVKIVDQMPKERKSKGRKTKKGKVYPGKMKMKKCPHILANFYFPDSIVEKFMNNHDVTTKVH